MLTHSVYARDIRVRRYAEYLARDGNHVDIICLQDENRGEQTNHPSIRVFPISMARRRREGLGKVAEWLLSAFLMFTKLSYLHMRHGYDLVHVHNMPDFLVFSALFPRVKGIPVIFNVHDPTPEIAKSKLGASDENTFVRAQIIIEKLSVGFSSAVITATPVFKDILVSRGCNAEKITVITNAADERIFPLVDPSTLQPHGSDQFTLLYVGTIADRYGLSTVIRALPMISSHIPGLKLSIYPKVRDEGAGLENMIRLADQLGVSDLVTLNPPAPLESMPDIMRSADLGLYPAMSDCHMDIALSLKIPEMANIGLPIVASRIPVLEDLYGEEAIAFVEPGNPDSLARKIIELYKHPEQRILFAKHAALTSRKLLWKNQYRIYIDLLENVLGKPISKVRSASI